MEKSLSFSQREALFIARKRPLQIKKGVSLILLKSLPKPSEGGDVIPKSSSLIQKYNYL